MKCIFKPLLALSLALALAACPEAPPSPADVQGDTGVTPDSDATTTPDDGGAAPDDGGVSPDATPDATSDDGGMTADDGGAGTDDGGPSTDTDPDTTTLPSPPALGALIDRAGRAGISSVLVGEFTGTDGASDDAYNVTAAADWAATWTDEIADNLAVYDSLDGTCGNQLLYTSGGGADAYYGLASLLADDRLYVDAGTTTCAAYLGVELGLTDCGGRKPSYDVIDGTYSVLANGGAAVIGDGVDADDGSVDEGTFPFLDMGGAAFPPAPALGALIDRAGRAGISTALVGEFTGTDGASDDAYQVDEQSSWGSTWTDEIADNLAVYDSLDGSCGNQLLYDSGAGADAYYPLATVLVDDRLYVNAGTNTCSAYLGVELGLTDCGGRRPGYDVIDGTYTVLAAGGAPVVPDGVPSDDGAVDESTFPFLDDPGLAFPNPPSLGALIDRAGRPGISTALIGEFTGSDGTSDDAYQIDEISDWATGWTDEIKANLAIYDSLDGTCGDQLLAAAGAPSADTYVGLAGVLADDRLYLDSAQTTCAAYLGVELGAPDCGGRTPSYDVIDATYSALATGLAAAIPDGVNTDDGTVDEATFPFLDDPGDPWPAPPALGGLIDRAGRPGISTALIGEFTGSDGTSDDAYQIDEIDDWATDWTDEIKANLAIYDSLDGTCGDQLLAAAGAPSANTYAGLAGVLVDDRLYLDSAQTTCAAYLGVELGAPDCGGRTPSYDVIDATYSALATGLAAAIPDGVNTDDGTVDEATFPFLDGPG